MSEKSGIDLLKELIDEVKLLNRRYIVIEQNVKELLARSNTAHSNMQSTEIKVNNKPITIKSTVPIPQVEHNKFNEVKVIGKIKNNENKFLSGVLIKIYDEKNNIIKNTKTNRAGEWMCFLPPDIQEERTTRIYIGDIFRYDKRFWPAITVRYSSGRYKPISFNQNQTIKYRLDLVLDGYGGKSYIRVPTHKIIAGSWEQNFEVNIASESITDREELTDIVSSFLIGKARQELYEAGLFIRSVNMSSEREEDWGNEKVYLQSVNVECYSEWRREIPIDRLVETINFCFNYGIFGSNNTLADNFLVSLDDVLIT